MHLHELLGWEGPMTHRQFLAWQEWLDGEYDRPSRADFYAMQTAAEVRSVGGMFAKGGGKVKLKDFLLKFSGGRRKKDTRSPEQKAAQAKALWRSRGMKPRSP